MNDPTIDRATWNRCRFRPGDPGGHYESYFQRANLFVGLRYDNPPGGHKTCLNTKLAACQLTLERPGQPPLSLGTRHRAAFEILTDDEDHGVPIIL
jgi:hypothetical protein